MAERLRTLRASGPQTRTYAIDPYGLRAVVALLLVTGFAFSFGPRGGRIADALAPLETEQVAGVRVDAWGDAPRLYGPCADPPDGRGGVRRADRGAARHRPVAARLRPAGHGRDVPLRRRGSGARCAGGRRGRDARCGGSRGGAGRAGRGRIRAAAAPERHGAHRDRLPRSRRLDLRGDARYAADRRLPGRAEARAQRLARSRLCRQRRLRRRGRRGEARHARTVAPGARPLVAPPEPSLRCRADARARRRDAPALPSPTAPMPAPAPR